MRAVLHGRRAVLFVPRAVLHEPRAVLFVARAGLFARRAVLFVSRAVLRAPRAGRRNRPEAALARRGNGFYRPAGRGAARTRPSTSARPSRFQVGDGAGRCATYADR